MVQGTSALPSLLVYIMAICNTQSRLSGMRNRTVVKMVRVVVSAVLMRTGEGRRVSKLKIGSAA
jgi:hypothetical protein